MSCTLRFTLALCVAGCILAVAQDSKPKFTARELFYSAATEPAPAAKETPPPTPTKATAKTVAKAPAKKATTAPAQAASTNPPPAHVPPATHVDAGHGSVDAPGTVTAPIIPAAYVPSSAPAPDTGTPLGLKYTILEKVGDQMVEVPRDTVFHAGDRIQFDVQTNGPGYLYIINQGSSGTWKPMFPSPELEDGNNKVDGWHSYTMPPKARWYFDTQTGVEKVFIVFSRNPEPDLENMIYSLQGGEVHPAAQQQPKAQPKQLVNVASLNINDTMVGRLRTTYSRDLIVEPVDDKTPADKSGKKENAVYVVNPTGSSDSRVVADFTLVHQ
jgi:hypothetical protein